MDKDELQGIRDEYWDASIEVDKVLLAHWATERGGSLLDYITQLRTENEQLRKIVARAINMLDMFADKSRGKYADEARAVSNELFEMLKALGDE